MKAVTVAKFRLGGKDFAVVPWSEYQRLTGKGAKAAKSPSTTTAHIRTPRLARPHQATDFRKQIVEVARDAEV